MSGEFIPIPDDTHDSLNPNEVLLGNLSRSIPPGRDVMDPLRTDPLIVSDESINYSEMFKVSNFDLDAFTIVSLCNNRVKPSDLPMLNNDDIKQIFPSDVGRRATLRCFVDSLKNNLSNVSASNKDKIRANLKIDAPLDLDILPSAEICNKIINNPLNYPFTLNSKDLSLNSQWSNLIKWLIAMSTIVKTDVVAPLTFLLRISDHGWYTLPKITQVISGQDLKQFWATLVNPPASIYRNDDNGPSIYLKDETHRPTNIVNIGNITKKPRTDSIHKNEVPCHKLAKFGNCLGSADGHVSCPFNHDPFKIENLRKEKGFKIVKP
jgi:hypothetical protein